LIILLKLPTYSNVHAMDTLNKPEKQGKNNKCAAPRRTKDGTVPMINNHSNEIPCRIVISLAAVSAYACQGGRGGCVLYTPWMTSSVVMSLSTTHSDTGPSVVSVTVV